MAASEAQYEQIGVQNPVKTEGNFDVPFTEGIDVGYRGFEQDGLVPRDPFGYGLCYTTFGYSKLNVTPGSTDGTRPVKVRFRLTSIGSRVGAGVPQVYLASPSSTGEPQRLVAFDKVTLRPGESRTIELTIDTSDVTHPLSHWDDASHCWVTTPGTYTMNVGSSSHDLPLQGTSRIR